MPELPEVEILARHLKPRVVGRRIVSVRILRRRSLWNSTPARFARALTGRRIVSLARRAKYLRLELADGTCFLAHLGMTGRLFTCPTLVGRREKHDVAHVSLERCALVFHDPRKFGHLELGDAALRKLGPEPLGVKFTVAYLAAQLERSRSPVKPRLLDQRIVVGLGNIYACEALWKARIDPRTPCRALGPRRVAGLHAAIVRTLREAIRFGGGLSMNMSSGGIRDGLFYYGSGQRRDNPSEHFAVYDREGKPCNRCRKPIARIVQGGRSTFYCPRCQSAA